MADALYHAFLPLIKLEAGVIGTLQEASGFPTDQLRTVLCMVSAIPFGFLMRLLPNATTKHVYSIALGLFFCTYTLGRWAWVHSFVSSLVAYLLIAIFPARYSNKLVFFWAMGYMCVSHIYRQYTDYLGWTLDFSGIQMLVTLKLVSIGWNYHDGVAPSHLKLDPEHERFAIRTLPSLLEFYGWIYFFPTLIAGPSLEVSDYLSYTNLSMFKTLPENRDIKNPSNYKIPSSILPTLSLFGQTLVLLVFTAVGAILNPWFLVNPEFLALPFIQKLWRFPIIVTLARFKYFFAWFLADTGCVASGIGFNGFDEKGKKKWDRCKNVLVWNVTLAQSMHDFASNWNIFTAAWLKRYVYTRVESKNKFVPLFATYITSAFWHGFYPGYYLFFVSAGFLTEAARETRRRIRPYFLKADGTPNQPRKFFYDVVCFINAHMALAYCGPSFLLLSFKNALAFWSSIYYFGHIVIFSYFVIVNLLPAPRVAKKPATATKAKAH